MTSLLKLFSFLFLIGLILNFPLIAMENEGNDESPQRRPLKRAKSEVKNKFDPLEKKLDDSLRLSARQKLTNLFLSFSSEDQQDIIENWNPVEVLCEARSTVHARIAKLCKKEGLSDCSAECYKDGASQYTLRLVSTGEDEEFNPKFFKHILNELKSEDALSILHLGIAYFNLNDECLRELIEALQVLPNIQGLGLHKCSLKSKGIIDLAHFLKTNSTIIALDISGNTISEDTHKALIDVFENNETLQALDLTNTRIDENLRIYLERCIKKNRSKNNQIYENYVGTLGSSLIYY